MVKKIASYVAVAATVIGSSVLPALAMDAGDVVAFPFKVVGSGLSTVAGAPLGFTKGGVQGSMKATRYVAGKMGNEDDDAHTIVGAVVGGPFGAVGGAAVGTVKGVVHGAKTGYDKPFTMESFQWKDD